MRKHRERQKMDIPVEEIRKILDALKELSEEQQRINERTDSLHERLISVLAEGLQKIYKKWRPRIGEKVVGADFSVYAPDVNILYVTLIDGNRCILAKTMEEKHVFEVLWFDEDVRDYEEPVFVLPLDVYAEMSKSIGLKEIG
jgi:DNA-binding transcriptional MerR regulator